MKSCPIQVEKFGSPIPISLIRNAFSTIITKKNNIICIYFGGEQLQNEEMCKDLKATNGNVEISRKWRLRSGRELN